jgi:outer membrane protein TolC
VNYRINLFVFLAAAHGMWGQSSFGSLDSVYAYADRNSSQLKISSQQNLLAKWTKVAAVANSINFRSPVSLSATDNMLLPVNFIPADFFGGPAGTYRQITLGQEYVTNFNFSPQIDIINPANLGRIRSAELNKQMTELNATLVKKSLYESIAAAWYNTASLTRQMVIAEGSKRAADSVEMIIGNKFKAGLAREQDLNNAKINVLNIQDRMAGLKANLEMQKNALAVLCDFPQGKKPEISAEIGAEEGVSKADAQLSLQAKYAALQGQYAGSELRANRLSILPVLSLVYYQGWQKNSNTGFFDAAAPWIQSRFLGLRLTMNFPPDVNRLSQNYNSKISSRIAGMSSAHAALQSSATSDNLDIDLERSITSFNTARQVAELKRSNYEKSYRQYKEGIIPAEILLTASTELLNAELNEKNALANCAYSREKIKLNNRIK